MNKSEALEQLKALGTEQNRKIYRRHGVAGPQFGVSFANINKLQKRIKTDHDLARTLWDTGNHDARVLATYIADPHRLRSGELDDWARAMDNYVIADAFSSLVIKTPFARKKMEKWTRSKGEWTGRAGWNLLAHLAMKDPELPDRLFTDYLKTIERRIHTQKNYTRHSMNSALIAVGIRNPKLQKEALAVASRIGKVTVDHGETGCKTPDATAYIKKTVSRKPRKKIAGTRPARKKMPSRR